MRNDKWKLKIFHLSFLNYHFVIQTTATPTAFCRVLAASCSCLLPTALQGGEKLFVNTVKATV